MKTFIIETSRSIIALLVVLGIWTGTARAQEYVVDGLLMSGTLAGQAIDRDVHDVGYGLAQPVTFSTHLFSNRHGKVCRNFIVFERRYGQLHKVVKTVCDNRQWRGHRHHFRGDHHDFFRHDNRHHFRHDNRHHGKGGYRHRR